MNDIEAALEAFSMGYQAGQAEHRILEGERKYVEEAKARLKEQALVLGVARWVIERDESDRATVVTFKIYDWDLRLGDDVEQLIARAKEYLRTHSS